MPLAPGTKLGPYEIVAVLGAGGMGEVFRAKDDRLGRDVAIKVLPEAFAKDSDRLRRFEQEARSVAALNHPNILGIHDIGSHEGRPYLVSELLEGETLREALDQSRIPIKRVIEYSKEIAHGLAAAHSKGIVHRDLKPENIFITRDSRIIILDFGLAKLIFPEENVENANTMTSPVTLPGMVMGTMGYMSPEQVKAEPTDARSDIFSFGSVLYEMLTGQRAFKRDTGAETMTAILREEPPELTESGYTGPLGLQKILGRCLEKSPDRRFQSAADLGFAIESLSDTSTGSASQAHRAAQQGQEKEARAWWPYAAAAAALAVVAIAAWFLGKSSFKPIQPKYTRLTYDRGYLPNARFSKDGSTILYSARWGDDPDFHIYSVRSDFPQSSKLDIPAASLLALSSQGEAAVALDSQPHANFISGTLAVVPMMGGTPRSQMKNVISADYAPDGKALALTRINGRQVDLEFPAGKVIYSTSGYLDYVRVAPDGQSVAFLEHNTYDDDRGWVILMDASGKRTQLTPEYATVQGLAWTKTGKEIWFSAADAATDRRIYAVSLSGKVRLVFNAPVRSRILDLSSDGRALFSSDEIRSDIIGIDPATGKLRSNLAWFNGTGISDLLPDGSAFAGFEWGGPSGPLYMSIYRKLDGSAPIHLGDGGGTRISPDGTLAAAKVPTIPPYMAMYPIGAGEARKFPLGDLVAVDSHTWFPDGKHLLLVAAKKGEGLRSYQLDLQTGATQPFGPAAFVGIAISNDGKRIAGLNDLGESVILDVATQQMRKIPNVPVDTASQLGPDAYGEIWTDDGKSLIVSRTTLYDGEIDRLDVDTGKLTPLQKIELTDKAGSSFRLRVLYARKTKTYVYRVVRILSQLYELDGLE